MGMSLDFPLEVEIESSTESFQKALESQQTLFHRQVGQLQNIVVTQCKLSGANPLSQEMAAGALSIKIGKRPRDLLNPKAVEYLHSVFSIKDVISKKESHDLAVRFGMTVTQVKEFFTSQKTRVRKFVRLSTEKAARLRDSSEPQDEMLSDSNPMTSIDPVPLNTLLPLTSDETSSGSNKEEVIDGIDEIEKYFVNNIFSMMRKEESFSGQVKLMEWILKMKNPSVLCWFLIKGGLMILATWLTQAATEEQTSVVTVALDVLNHLPLNKALPLHMSAAIQGVNRLRFYPKSEISAGARVLLSRWSKMFAKSEAMRKPNGTNSSDAHKVIDLKQRISELIGDDSWQSTINSGDSCGPNGAADETRRLEPPQAIKLLTASADDSTKKQALGSTYKERRKVLLVEQPGQKTAAKIHQAPKTVVSTQARPITADEIRKAKLRAQFMQNKHSKIDSSSDNCKSKSEGPKRPSSSLLTNDLLSASEAYFQPKLEAHKKARFAPVKTNKPVEDPSDPKLTTEPDKILVKGAEKLRRVQLPWKRPPDVKIDESWKVATGEDSKEVDVQRNRIHREKETIYKTPQEIPPYPKDPWDIEMDYDDTLTIEIPIDQLPDDSDTSPQEETQLITDPPPVDLSTRVTNPTPTAAPAAATTSQSQTPDLDLLAMLLKNPQLVFALTTGQNTGLPNVDPVKLLDMLKLNTGLVGSGFAVDKQAEEVVSLPSPTPTIPARNGNVETSFPSPTPASRYEVTSLPSPTPSIPPPPPPLNGWQQEAAVAAAAQKNPFSRQVTTIPGGSSIALTQPSGGTNRLTQKTSLVQNGYADYTAPSTFMPSEKQVSNQMQHVTDYYRQSPQQHMRDSTTRANASSSTQQQFPANEQQRFHLDDDLRGLIKTTRQGLSPSSYHHHPPQHNHSVYDSPSRNMSGVGRNHVINGSGYRSSLSPEINPNRYSDYDDREHRYGYQQQEMIHPRGYGAREGPYGRNSRHQGDNNGNWNRGGRRWNDRTR